MILVSLIPYYVSLASKWWEITAVVFVGIYCLQPERRNKISTSLLRYHSDSVVSHGLLCEKLFAGPHIFHSQYYNHLELDLSPLWNILIKQVLLETFSWSWIVDLRRYCNKNIFEIFLLKKHFCYCREVIMNRGIKGVCEICRLF